jgi:hypothetical protein
VKNETLGRRIKRGIAQGVAHAQEDAAMPKNFHKAMCFVSPLLWAYLSGWFVAKGYWAYALGGFAIAVIAQMRLVSLLESERDFSQ